jgi:hypothetical protein
VFDSHQPADSWVIGRVVRAVRGSLSGMRSMTLA